MAKKLRYRLHWASGHGPKPSLKWAIYDWKLICPVAYTETRVNGRKLCDFLNAIDLPMYVYNRPPGAVHA